MFLIFVVIIISGWQVLEFFLHGVLHADESLRHFTLQQLASASSNAGALESLLDSPLFDAVLARVLDESTLVSDCAVQLVATWVRIRLGG